MYTALDNEGKHECKWCHKMVKHKEKNCWKNPDRKNSNSNSNTNSSDKKFSFKFDVAKNGDGLCVDMRSED